MEKKFAFLAFSFGIPNAVYYENIMQPLYVAMQIIPFDFNHIFTTFQFIQSIFTVAGGEY